MTRRPQLSLAHHAVLAVIGEQPCHGWAVVRELAPDGDLGRIWTLSRPLAYRALEELAERRLVRATRTERGDGPRRTIFATTSTGRREVERWLAAPVEHPRDVRTELLLKVTLARRRHLDTQPLLRAQLERFQPVFAALARAARSRDADVVDAWRHQSALTIERFIRGQLRPRSNAR